MKSPCDAKVGPDVLVGQWIAWPYMDRYDKTIRLD